MFIGQVCSCFLCSIYACFEVCMYVCMYVCGSKNCKIAYSSSKFFDPRAKKYRTGAQERTIKRSTVPHACYRKGRGTSIRKRIVDRYMGVYQTLDAGAGCHRKFLSP